MDVLYLFHRYRDDVYRLAMNYTRSRQEAEEVCQTVFLKLLEQKDLAPGKEKAWLMQVTANECRSLLRSAWWRRTVPLDDSISVPAPQVNQTLHALGKLKPEYRVVLYLHYYEQYTTAEIAQLLKLSVSGVTTRLNRGRKRLRKLLEEG